MQDKYCFLKIELQILKLCVVVKKLDKKHKMLFLLIVSIQKKVIWTSGVSNRFYLYSSASRCAVTLTSQLVTSFKVTTMNQNVTYLNVSLLLPSKSHLMTRLSSRCACCFLTRLKMPLQWSHITILMWLSFGDCNVKSSCSLHYDESQNNVITKSYEWFYGDRHLKILL